jgi:hypothetical protein
MPFQMLEPGWLLGMVNGVLGSSVDPILGVALIYLQVDGFSLSFAWVFSAFSQWSHSNVSLGCHHHPCSATETGFHLFDHQEKNQKPSLG